MKYKDVIEQEVKYLRQTNTKLQKQVDELQDICLDCPYKLKFDEIEKQAVKDTAKEILQTIKRAKENGQIHYNEAFMITAQKAYGVEVE